MGTCPNCGETFEAIGHHFRLSDCEYPTPSTETQRNIDRILIGDAALPDMGEGCKSKLVINNCKGAFVDYQAEMLPDWLISNHILTEQKAENAKDTHTLYTVAMPFFTELRDRWYVNGKKVIPYDIEMDEEMFKLWVLSDGRISWRTNSKDSHHYEIACSRSKDRADFLENLVEEVGLEAAHYGRELAFRTGYNDDIREMLGEPIEGYEYKWAETRDEYDRLRGNHGKTEANSV